MKDLNVSDVDAFCNPRKQCFLISSHSNTTQQCKTNAAGFHPNSTIPITFKWSELKQKNSDFIGKINQLRN